MVLQSLSALLAPSILLPLLLLGAISYITTIIINRIYFHPFSKCPGPFLGKFSDIVIFRSIIQENRTTKMYQLMEEYGSPMRIATDQLLFRDAQSWIDISGQHSRPMLRDPSLSKMFTATGAVSMLSTDDRVYHARLKRLMTKSFSEKGILEFEELIADKVDTCMEYVFAPEAKKGEWFDLWAPMQKHYLDIISHLSFGVSFNCIKGENPHALEDMGHFLTVIPARVFFPTIRHLPLRPIQEAYKGLARLVQFSRDHVARYIDAVENENGEKSGRTDAVERGGDGTKSFLRNLVTNVDEETGTKLTFDELVENAIIFLVGGGGTSAVVTTYFVWEVARNPVTHKRLVEEVRTAFPNQAVMPTYDVASKLAFFSSVMQEVLRLWGPLNNASPRASPPGGRSVSGHHIPAGMMAATLCYASARDPEVFPDPEVFKADRWMAPSADMKALCKPFSTGPRACIGRHLAEVQMTLTLTRLFQLYDLEVGPKTRVDDMKLRDKGVMEPYGGKLMIKVRRIGRQA